MSDDHSPQAGCNFRQCGIPEDAHNCPFTKEATPDAANLGLVYVSEQHEHVHEWRQVSNHLDLRFFCTRCLEIRKLEKTS